MAIQCPKDSRRIQNGLPGDIMIERIKMSPRVLTVTPDFPFPASSGLHLRMASNLGVVHRVGCYNALLFFSTEERPPTSPESLQLPGLCDAIHYAGPRFPQELFRWPSLVRHKTDFLLRGALSLPGKAYPFSMRYDAVGARDLIVREAARTRADVIVLPSIFLHYTPALCARGHKVIIDAADVLTDVSASFLSHYASHARAGRFGLYANYLACRAQERIFLPYCSEVWATSQAEAAVFARITPEPKILVIPNALDEDAVVPSPAVETHSVGFIGSYSYLPNVDAALFLAEEVFPHLLRGCPAARLRLAGAGMPDATRARLQQRPYVELLGRVSDSGEFMDSCAVMALPIRVRGGVPLKLIEAMAKAKPVVARPELVQGLPVEDGADLLIRSNPIDYAGAIETLLRNRSEAAQLGNRARITFLQNWSLSHAVKVVREQSILG